MIASCSDTQCYASSNNAMPVPAQRRAHLGCDRVACGVRSDVRQGDPVASGGGQHLPHVRLGALLETLSAGLQVCSLEAKNETRPGSSKTPNVIHDNVSRSNHVTDLAHVLRHNCLQQPAHRGLHLAGARPLC